MLHLAENIKTIRELANKTQLEFAQLFEVKSKKGEYSKDKIFSYESGKAIPPDILIEYIAEFARVSVEDLKNKKLSRKDIDLGPDVLGFVPFSDDPASKQKITLKEDQSPENKKNLNSSDKSETIEALKNNIKTLEAHNKSLEKIQDFLEEKIKTLESNLMTSLKNQTLIQRQISVAFQLVLEQVVADEEKRVEILDEFDKLTFADRD
jgi:transcriptional regulator with XRE-family HTH domain